MQQTNYTRAVLSGLAATAAMTVLMLMAPMMGLPPMNIGQMLGSVMGGSVVLGWAAHFVIGSMLAVIYARVFAGWLRGPFVARGATYSLLPWLVSQTVVSPMMGGGFFSKSMVMAVASLTGHVVYGLVLGAMYADGAELHLPGRIHAPA